MKKIIRKIFCFVLIFSIVFTSNSYAHLDTHLSHSMVNTIVNYNIENNAILEIATIQIKDEKIETKRYIYPDNTFEMEVTNVNSKETINVSGEINYKEFEKIAEEYYEKNDLSFDLKKIRTNGDITGKQFKHRRLGNTRTTLYRRDLDNLSDISGVIALLAGKLSTKVAVIAGIAAIVFNRISRTAPEKMIIDVTSYDNNYYTHCYHSIIKSYDRGRLIDTTKEYYQSIGG